jgi:NADPH-dependent glutamate synthase beta subunit-like oxidoreductase
MPVSVAIVGSGPAGFYTAAALLKSGADVTIDIIERLPAPYGLIRFGVAPDHAKTKNVQASYARTAEDERVRYFGNVEVGRDVTMDELRETYDAVVLATGASVDRPLGIPGDDKTGIVGVAAFVGWYNGHPDFRDLDPPLDTESVVVIGVGNVAVDVARVLTKTPAEMAATDITDYSAAAINAAPIQEVYMVGRRGPAQAKFSNVELREMGQLENCAPVIDAAIIPDEVPADVSPRDARVIERNLGTLREFAAMDPGNREKRVHFTFFASPVEVLGGGRVEAVKFERTRVDEAGRAEGLGEYFEIPCGLVIPAIGYYSEPIEGVPFDTARGRADSNEGYIDDGFYCVGWIKRGPSGVIGSNKPDGDKAAEMILEAFPRGKKPGREALAALLAERGVRVVDFEAWKKIDAAEIAAATGGAPRAKLTRIEDMLKVLDG